MLLKCPQSEKRSRANASSKQQRSSSSSTTESSSAAMKLTTLAPRLHRKAVKKTHAGEARVAAVDPCDNSNDSGLGFDNHLEYHHLARTTVRFADQEHTWTDDHPDVKRKKLEIKLESDDANDDFSFPETVSLTRKRVDFRGSAAPSGTGDPSTVVGRRLPDPQARPQQRQVPARPPRNPGGPASLNTQLTGVSSDGRTHLQILCQPEQQHRARYQTEGSRGAVKDRSGNGFPVVKLVGYDKPATLQVFIGTDLGRVAPHMFYQACRVSGKNSTPCVEKKIDGTVVIEVDFDPAKDMVVTCDCVGILKERNVDVEHRFPDQSGARNKKKSTRCRMVFRTTVTHDDGSTEVLQTTSQPIVCTQPPGVPEICKKSVSACPSSGGLELFILGKNFLKDTKVVFQQSDSEPCWEETVQPDKEYLQQTHLVCVVPPYRRVDIADPVTVKLMVSSSGKMSEPHTFTYLPTTNPVVATALQVPVGAAETLLPPPGEWLPAPVTLKERPAAQLSRVLLQRHKAGGDAKEAVLLWSKAPKLPPPLLPLPARVAPAPLKTEAVGVDEGPEDLRTKQPPPPMATVADLSSTQSPSMATFRQFVSDSNFLAQSAHSIEKYLNHIECKEAAAPTAADKLDALVNSAAATHMAPVMMEAPPATSPIAVKQMMMEAPSATSPIAVKQMMMEAPTATSPIAVKQMMMEAPTATSPIAVKQMMMEAPTATSPIAVKQMMMEAPTATSPIAVKQMMMEGPTATSPIAVKQMMMDATSTSPIAVKQMMMDTPSTSPIAVKQMMMDDSSTSPIVVKQMMMDDPSTSPIVVKQMMMDDSSTSPIVVKQMMMDDSSTSPIVVKQMMMDDPSTSPIVVKQMIMDSSSTSPITVNQMMMDPPSTSPIAVNQMMMEPSSTSPIAVNQMMRDAPATSPIAVKQMMMEPPVTSPIAVKQMMMDAPSSSPIAVQQMMMESPSSSSCSSPIAVKQMIMDAPSTSPIAVKQMMMEGPGASCTPPIAVKQMMMDTPSTSPITVQQMMMESPSSSSCSSPIAVKQMMMDAPVKQMMMDAPATSPIAVKQMIMESPPHPAVCTSPIAIKTMLLGGAGSAPLDAILNQAATGEPSPLCSLIAPVGAASPTTPQAPSAPALLDAVYGGGAGGLLMAATGAEKMGDAPQIVAAPAAPQQPAPSTAPATQKKCEEGMLPQELTQMSDNDLISYINPSTFDAV